MNRGEVREVPVSVECTLDTREEGSVFVPLEGLVRAEVKGDDLVIGEVNLLRDGSVVAVVYADDHTECWRISPKNLWVPILDSIVTREKEQ